MDYYLDIMGAYSDSVYHEHVLTNCDTFFCMGHGNVFPLVRTALLPLYVGSIKEMEEACMLSNPGTKHFI